MSRPQISNDFGNRLPAIQARPVAQTEATPSADQRWQGLAAAFAQGDLLLETNRQQKAAEDEARARRFAHSVTVDELGKKIKAGEMLASESPVFAATLQHIWGSNAQAAAERDVLSKVTRGEVKFGSAQEVDQWLTEQRNSSLSGHSEYAAAGWDKAHGQFREKLMATVAQTNDKEVVDKAANEATDFLANKLLEVSSPDFKGTPQEAAAALMQQYQTLRSTKTLPDGAARGALGELLTRAAASGNKDLIGALLDTDMPEVGKVRNLIGETKAATLAAQADSKYDQAQRQRIDDEALPWHEAADRGELNDAKFTAWATSEANKKYVTSSFITSLRHQNQAALAAQQRELVKARLEVAVQASEYEARQKVEASFAAGRGWEVQGTNVPQVIGKNGEIKPYDWKPVAEDYLKRTTTNLPFDQQVSAWAMNGLTNPDWNAQLGAGFLNLSSIGVDAKGKPTGTLNDAGKRAIELFRQLDAVNPDAAKKTAGDGAYERFSNIAFLMHLGRDPSDAAAIAANAAAGATPGTPGAKLEKEIAGKVSEMTDVPWSDWLANKWGAAQDLASDTGRVTRYLVDRGARAIEAAGLATLGDFSGAGAVLNGGDGMEKRDSYNVTRNTTPNTAQVHGWVKRYATLLAHSGQVGDADAALRVAVEYIQRPEVSAKVNGTLYLRSEMPAPPSAGESQDDWLARFIDAVPKARAKELGFAGGEVRVEYDERVRGYRPFVAGVPLTSEDGTIPVYSRRDIEKWFAEEHRKDQLEATQKARDGQEQKAHEAFTKRLWGEVGSVQKGDRFAMERYDPTYGHKFFGRNLLSLDAYRRILKDGNQDKPLGELMKLYPNRKRGDK